MELKDWITVNKLTAEISANICEINNKKYLILSELNSPILDENFEFIFNTKQEQILSINRITDVVFNFGDNWYYSDINEPKLNILKYLGHSTNEIEIDFPYLGIRGEYELCNGSKTYKEWCKKALFLKYSTLGICEKNTLAGTLSFQLACQDAKIKPILGETVTVCKDREKGYVYEVKLFVKNYDGWVNLLNINSQIKVFNEQPFVDESYLLERANGLVCVIALDVDLKSFNLKNYQEKFKDDLYYQLDFTEWSAIDREKLALESIGIYLDNYFDIIKPVIISDSFYLDKEQNHIKKVLNSIGKVGFQNQSKDQYFKSIEDIYFQIEELSPNSEWTERVFDISILNTIELEQKCNFQIKLGELHLPKYEMIEEESSQFQTNEELFLYLIEKGLREKKLTKDEEEYLSRIETEVEVISRGGFVDYFLITWDIINWCERNNILTGIGRGSAAGSLISYLLGITKIDPLKYDLLFERFLNSGRFKTSNVDIIIIETEDGDIELDFNKKVSILRNGIEKEILTQELESNDQIINIESVIN